MTIKVKNLKIIGIVLVSVLVLVLLQVLASAKKAETDCDEGVCAVEIKEEKITAEKIEVFHFHATQQCWSCITIADFTQKTLTNRYPNELENGRIVYRSIDIDLPENKEVAQKYNATGSALFINLIYDGKDHISEDVAVWRLVNSETQFTKYLGDKLEKYL